MKGEGEGEGEGEAGEGVGEGEGGVRLVGVGLFHHIAKKGVRQGVYQTRPNSGGVSRPREKQLEQSGLLFCESMILQKLLDVGLIQLELKRSVCLRRCVLGWGLVQHEQLARPPPILIIWVA